MAIGKKESKDRETERDRERQRERGTEGGRGLVVWKLGRVMV